MPVAKRRRRRLRSKAEEGAGEIPTEGPADLTADNGHSTSWLNALAAMSLRGVEVGAARPNLQGSASESGPSLLHVAVMEGDMSQIDELLQAGADPNEATSRPAESCVWTRPDGTWPRDTRLMHAICCSRGRHRTMAAPR